MARFKMAERITFEVILDTKNDVIDVEKWESEIFELLNKEYYVDEVKAVETPAKAKETVG